MLFIITMTFGLRTFELILHFVISYQIEEESYLSKCYFEFVIFVLFSHVKYIFNAISIYDYSLPINLIVKQKTYKVNNLTCSRNNSINSSNIHSYLSDENNDEYLLLDFENSISLINAKSNNILDNNYYSNKLANRKSNQDFFNLLMEYLLIIIKYLFNQIVNSINLFGVLDEKLCHIENYHYLKNLNEYMKHLISKEDHPSKTNIIRSDNVSLFKKIPEIILSRFLEKVKSYSTEIEDLVNVNPKEKENLSKVFYRTLLFLTGEIRTNYFLSQETNSTVLLLSVEALLNYYKLQLKELKNNQDFDFSKLEKITQSYEFLVR